MYALIFIFMLNGMKQSGFGSVSLMNSQKARRGCSSGNAYSRAAGWTPSPPPPTTTSIKLGDRAAAADLFSDQ